MDALTREEVEQIALLARLELDDDEIERLRTELAAILGHMDALREVDTEGIEPMTHAVPMHLRLRADQVEPSLPVEEALAAAPAHDDDCFVVPPVIEARAK
jgi:aspartyl-tRNA(Asn)/glutamyl-tRNA(Gln) amidotransferase subunit C